MESNAIFKFHAVADNTTSGPVLVNSPHSGRDYSMVDMSALKCGMEKLRVLEDTLIDVIAQLAQLAQYGITSLEALFPRSYIDPNRALTSLDKLQIRGWTGRHISSFIPDFYTALGCGLVPVRAAAEGFEIYDAANYPTEDDIAGRLKYYKAYHHQLQQALHDLFNRFGGYALLDMHSCYPSGIIESGARENRADIILSNCHGQSCSDEFMHVVKAAFLEQGLTDIAINHPFKGGYITSHYGKGGMGIFASGHAPSMMKSDNIHALQIELNKRLYWDFEKQEEKADAEPLKRANIAVFRAVNDYMMSLG